MKDKWLFLFVGRTWKEASGKGKFLWPWLLSMFGQENLWFWKAILWISIFFSDLSSLWLTFRAIIYLFAYFKQLRIRLELWNHFFPHFRDPFNCLIIHRYLSFVFHNAICKEDSDSFTQLFAYLLIITFQVINPKLRSTEGWLKCLNIVDSQLFPYCDPCCTFFVLFHIKCAAFVPEWVVNLLH